MKTKQKNKNPSYWNEVQNLASEDSNAPNYGACEDLDAEPIKSVNATILQINDRIITIRVPSANVVELEGKDVRINGLKAVWVRSLPSSEAEDEKFDVTNALLFRVAKQVVPSSFKVASVCEVTWK